MKRSYMRPRPKRNPMPEGRRDEVFARSLGRCEACGGPLREDSWECHHRRTRGMGGSARPETHALSNLLALCRGCHLACTHAVDEWPRIYGWTVSQYAEPARVAVWYRGARWVLLADDGRLLEVAA